MMQYYQKKNCLWLGCGTTVMLLAASLIVELEAVIGENRFAKPSGEKVLPLLAVSCSPAPLSCVFIDAAIWSAVGCVNWPWLTIVWEAGVLFYQYIMWHRQNCRWVITGTFTTPWLIIKLWCQCGRVPYGQICGGSPSSNPNSLSLHLKNK